MCERHARLKEYTLQFDVMNDGESIGWKCVFNQSTVKLDYNELGGNEFCFKCSFITIGRNELGYNELGYTYQNGLLRTWLYITNSVITNIFKSQNWSFQYTNQPSYNEPR